MNFFGRGKLYFRGRETTSDRMSDPISKLQRQYRRFCESPVVTKEKLDEDFIALCEHEPVSQVAIVPTDDGRLGLIVGLKMVVLRDMCTHRLHEIGEMAIVMRRSPNPEMYVYNKTRIISLPGMGSCHHPHVPSSGIICTSYLPLIMQAIASGQVRQAVEWTIEALHTYGLYPYLDVNNWPWVLGDYEEEKDA